MVECSKSDWKLFRSRIGEWQENYMKHLNEEYIELLSSEGNPSDKFWKLDERIKKDKKRPGVILELKKQKVAGDLATLVYDNAITFTDLEGFSDELKEQVKLFLK